MTAAPYTNKGASISACGRYRYLLWREWRGFSTHENWRWFGAKDGAGHELGEPKSCVFIMLNPSTADGETDDPTIRRCVAFAKAWKYDRLEVVNLFAHRATNPRELLALGHGDDPVGHENQDHVEEAALRAGVIICAWGAHGGHLGGMKRYGDGSPPQPMRLGSPRMAIHAIRCTFLPLPNW